MERTSAAVQQLRAAHEQLGGSSPSAAMSSSLVIVTCAFELLPRATLFFPTTVQIWRLLETHQRQRSRFDAAAANLLSPTGGVFVMDPRSQQETSPQPWLIASSSHNTPPIVIHAEMLRKVMLDASRALPHCVVENAVSRPGAEFWAVWDPARILRELRPAQEAATFRDLGVNGRSFESRQPGYPGELLRPLATTPIVATVNVMAEEGSSGLV